MKSMLDESTSHLERKELPKITENPCVKLLLYLQTYTWYKCILLLLNRIRQDAEILGKTPLLYLEEYSDTGESSWSKETSRTFWDSVRNNLAISWKICWIQASPTWNAEISPSNWDSASQCLAMSWKVHMIQESPAWNEENSFTRRMGFRESKPCYIWKVVFR